MKSLTILVITSLTVFFSMTLDTGRALAEVHARSFPLRSDATPAAAPTVIIGIVALGTYPPLNSSSQPIWPCFTGGTDADCSSIPAGGVVVGIPTQDWSLAACNVAPGAACAQIYWSFTSNISGTVTVNETITQGSNIVYQSGTSSLGPGTAPFLTFVWDEIGMGPNACSGCVPAVKGPAKITTTATVGSVTATGHATIIMH